MAFLTMTVAALVGPTCDVEDAQCSRCGRFVPGREVEDVILFGEDDNTRESVQLIPFSFQWQEEEAHGKGSICLDDLESGVLKIALDCEQTHSVSSGDSLCDLVDVVTSTGVEGLLSIAEIKVEDKELVFRRHRMARIAVDVKVRLELESAGADAGTDPTTVTLSSFTFKLALSSKRQLQTTECDYEMLLTSPPQIAD